MKDNKSKQKKMSISFYDEDVELIENQTLRIQKECNRLLEKSAAIKWLIRNELKNIHPTEDGFMMEK